MKLNELKAELKECKYCKKSFKSTRKDNVFCSGCCQKQWAYANSPSTRKRIKQYNKDYNNDHYQKNKERLKKESKDRYLKRIGGKYKKRGAENNPRWNGGKRFDKDGYILIHSPNHPHKDGNKCVREHRLVIEKAIGRILDKKEVVHHINGIRGDNRLENLELFSSAGKHTAKNHMKRDKSGRLIK